MGVGTVFIWPHWGICHAERSNIAPNTRFRQPACRLSRKCLGRFDCRAVHGMGRLGQYPARLSMVRVLLDFVCGLGAFYGIGNGRFRASSGRVPVARLLALAACRLGLVSGAAFDFESSLFFRLQSVPAMVNTDEIVCMNVQKEQADLLKPDPWGTTNYFGFPAGSFYLIGTMAKVMGGMTLEIGRLANAFWGLLLGATVYLFFRLKWPPLWSFLAALMAATNQAVLGISRMALLHSLAVWIEVAALVVLWVAWRRRSLMGQIFGGLFAGLGVYFYYSARITLVLWMAYLIVYTAERQPQKWVKNLLRSAWPVLMGFILCSGPMAVASLKSHGQIPDYAQQQLVIYAKGRALVRQWEGTSNTAAALRSNLWRGLTAFNNQLSDRGNIYVNPGHGFTDPLSGILLWVGIAAAIKRRRAFDQFALSGFVTLWLGLSFLTTKNPEFERLMSVTPFLYYFIMNGLLAIPYASGRWVSFRKWGFTFIVLGVGVWNVRTCWHKPVLQRNREIRSDHGALRRVVQTVRVLYLLHGDGSFSALSVVRWNGVVRLGQLFYPSRSEYPVVLSRSVIFCRARPDFNGRARFL